MALLMTLLAVVAYVNVVLPWASSEIAVASLPRWNRRWANIRGRFEPKRL
ncbi:hypothetical protein M8494_37915 [Serratia ureilytica]